MGLEALPAPLPVLSGPLAKAWAGDPSDSPHAREDRLEAAETSWAAQVSYWSVRIATDDDAKALAEHMRPEDVAEVWASDRWTPYNALIHSMERSDASWTLMLGFEVGAMFGVTPLNLVGGVGVAWALTGDAVDRYPFSFAKACRHVVKELSGVWPELINHVDARYVRSVRWAKWLGFEVHPAARFGKSEIPFHPITLKRRPEWVR